MSSDPTPLDIAAFQLDALTKTVDARVKLMKAIADFNFRMMEVAKLQVEVATDIVKLAILRDAFEDYLRARRKAMRQIADLEKQAERQEVAILRLSHLLKGETVTVNQSNFGWIGFRFLTANAPFATIVKLGNPRCSATDRKGKNFFLAHAPEEVPENAPSTIRHSLHLMDWSRKQRAVPKLGSSTLVKLAELLEILGVGAVEELAEVESELAIAQAELARIRGVSWKHLDIESEPPKESAAA